MESVSKQQVLRQGGAFLRHVVPAIVKPLHTLWNEVIGFFFLAFGTIFGFRTARYLWAHDNMRALVAGICTAIMAWYGFTSFRKARKISRS